MVLLLFNFNLHLSLLLLTGHPCRDIGQLWTVEQYHFCSGQVQMVHIIWITKVMGWKCDTWTGAVIASAYRTVMYRIQSFGWGGWYLWKNRSFQAWLCEHQRCLVTVRGSGGILPWGNFVVMGLKIALFLHSRPGLSGKRLQFPAKCGSPPWIWACIERS